MTSQVPDSVVLDGKSFEIVGIDGSGLFDPHDHIDPSSIHTGIGRGCVCTYEVVDRRLLLTRLHLAGRTFAGDEIVDGTALLGGMVEEGSLSLHLPVSFTGRLLLGDTWVKDLYEHLGFMPAWKYLQVRELVVDAGRIVSVDDLTDEIAELRRAILGGEVKAPDSLFEPFARIRRTFEQDYGRTFTGWRRIGAYAARERARAVAWRRLVAPDISDEHPELAREMWTQHRTPAYCLRRGREGWNLLHRGVEELFAELEIPWHDSVRGGPSNHLLDSQVQCANALWPMVHDPERLVRAFASVVDLAEVLEVEPGRHLTFEYIGPEDFFGEVRGGRQRGTKCTSVDAAFLCRTSDGATELVLVEWKYTESYERRPDEKGDVTRTRRYGRFLDDPDGPVDGSLLPRARWFDEPFYQLTRQQLLAWQLEVAGVADRVRVVLVLSPENEKYQRSVHRDEHRALGSTVSEIWSRLLRRPDRFSYLDPAVFLDPQVTSSDYVERYGEEERPAADVGNPCRQGDGKWM